MTGHARRLHQIIFFSLLIISIIRLWITNFSSLHLAESLWESVTTRDDMSRCVYRDYPSPDRHSGLPFLADVFASHDAQWVYFVAINRAMCNFMYKESDRFSAKNGVAHRFVCAFPNGALVLTEFILANGAHDTGNVIRCRIPADLQHLVASPQNFTRLHLSLHALEDLQAEPVGQGQVKPFPSIDIRSTPKLEKLPVCHAVEKPTMGQRYNMTAVTRIKVGPFNNGLGLFNDPNRNNTMSLQYEILIEEWIHHHVKLGMDHFILYVHDETPHGRLKDALMPMIDSGLVTYKWFPLDDCLRQNGSRRGHNDGRGHTAATLSALHRYGHTTRYMAHMDVDELFIPLQHQDLLQLMEAEGDKYDVVAFRPYLMVPCNGTHIPQNETSIVKKWRCWDGHYAANKLIFRPERLWQYWVHYPLSTPEGNAPETKLLNDTTEGLLAHYRRSNDKPWRTDEFSGLVLNGKTKRLEAIDLFEQKL